MYKIKLSANIKYGDHLNKAGEVISIKAEELEAFERAGVVDEIVEEVQEEEVQEEEVNPEELDFENMKVEDLKQIAKEKDIQGYNGMKKDELIAALRGGQDGNESN